ncbi:unnamed protein product [Vitrella brassicaformis CCMP3155]|uniref:Uncharacterized protein n=1 Tax=Vitrella brassicaformis (strain CCMP3155) TaxID=1169540 RepID=A0A0G4ES51_VITBC|nr:unnamed protein product [Vitrella brassicaformis CCMP3155]|eukprot:CEM00732.1 unnamed protein product [Vitrella brassicaformis CCMP3155]
MKMVLHIPHSDSYRSQISSRCDAGRRHQPEVPQPNRELHLPVCRIRQGARAVDSGEGRDLRSIVYTGGYQEGRRGGKKATPVDEVRRPAIAKQQVRPLHRVVPIVDSKGHHAVEEALVAGDDFVDGALDESRSADGGGEEDNPSVDARAPRLMMAVGRSTGERQRGDQAWHLSSRSTRHEEGS